MAQDPTVEAAEVFIPAYFLIAHHMSNCVFLQFTATNNGVQCFSCSFSILNWILDFCWFVVGAHIHSHQARWCSKRPGTTCKTLI